MALASFLEADPARLIVLGYVAEREVVVVGRSPLVRLFLKGIRRLSTRRNIGFALSRFLRHSRCACSSFGGPRFDFDLPDGK